MKIYVAASSAESESSRVDTMIGALRRMGHEVTSRWPAIVLAVANDSELSMRNVVRSVMSDVSDIRRSDAVVFLSPPDGLHTHGGFWEIGFAHGIGKPVFSAGSFASIFLATTEHYDTDAGLRDALERCVR